MPSSANWYSVSYGNGRFVAVTNGTATAAYSTDGITWTAATMPSSANWVSVTYGNGRFVAVAYGTTVASAFYNKSIITLPKEISTYIKLKEE